MKRAFRKREKRVHKTKKKRVRERERSSSEVPRRKRETGARVAVCFYFFCLSLSERAIKEFQGARNTAARKNRKRKRRRGASMGRATIAVFPLCIRQSFFARLSSLFLARSLYFLYHLSNSLQALSRRLLFLTSRRDVGYKTS